MPRDRGIPALQDREDVNDTTPPVSEPVCQCTDVLIDSVRETVGHPYLACPFHGKTTTLAAYIAATRKD